MVGSVGVGYGECLLQGPDATPQVAGFADSPHFDFVVEALPVNQARCPEHSYHREGNDDHTQPGTCSA